MKYGLFVFPCTAFCLLGTQCLASGILTSFDALNATLGAPDANAVLDMTDSAMPVSGNVQVADGQSVVMQNIAAWTNVAGAGDVVTPRMIENAGTLTLKHVNVLNNKLFVSSGEKGGGAVIHNLEHISEISDSAFDNNFVGSIPKNDLWGGIINNAKDATINVIKNTSFTNNSFATAQSAPHGAILYNAGLIERIENVDFYDNNMVAQANFKGGAHGVALDNNQYSEIGTITNVRFVNNRTFKPGNDAPEGHASGGALDNYNIIGEISNSLFQGNIAESESKTAMGGAIKNSYATNNGAIGLIDLIKEVDFIENRALNSNGYAYGGAYSTSNTSSNLQTKVNNMQDVLFRGNYASASYDTADQVAAYGGAIYNYSQIGKISGHFIDNYAENKQGISSAQGGAIHNAVAGSNIGEISAEFVGNYATSAGGAASGGAIWNAGVISLNNSTFSNNSVVGAADTTTDGGAIWNSGTVRFVGTNTFSGNTSSTGTVLSKNDIYNSGTINISDNSVLSISGGITGMNGTLVVGDDATLQLNDATISGNSVTMSDGATLSMLLHSNKAGLPIDGNVILNGNTNLNLSVLFDGGTSGVQSYAISKSIDTTNGDWTLGAITNALYDISATLTDARNVVELSYERKSVSDIASSLNIDNSDANMLVAVLNPSDSNSDFNALSQDFVRAAQSGDRFMGRSLSVLKDSAVATTNILTRHANNLANVIQSTRFSGDGVGRSGGDALKTDINVWARGMYLSAKDRGNSGFLSNGVGGIIGADAMVNDALTVGVAYSFSQTDVDSTGRDLEMKSHNLIAYGQYHYNDWVYDAMAMYGVSDIDQNKSVLSYTIDAEYDTDVLGGQISVGRRFAVDMTDSSINILPRLGLRYYHVSQDEYTDTYGITYSSDSSDILTAVAGTRVEGGIQFGDTAIQQKAYVNATYDVLADGSDMLIQLPNANVLAIDGELGARFGIELGYGVSFDLSDSCSVGVNYEFDIRSEYTSHMVGATLQYLF